MSLQEIVDRLGWFKQLGVTMSAVPIPPVADMDAYLDYAQWVIEEVKPSDWYAAGKPGEPIKK